MGRTRAARDGRRSPTPHRSPSSSRRTPASGARRRHGSEGRARRGRAAASRAAPLSGDWPTDVAAESHASRAAPRRDDAASRDHPARGSEVAACPRAASAGGRRLEVAVVMRQPSSPHGAALPVTRRVTGPAVGGLRRHESDRRPPRHAQLDAPARHPRARASTTSPTAAACSSRSCASASTAPTRRSTPPSTAPRRDGDDFLVTGHESFGQVRRGRRRTSRPRSAPGTLRRRHRPPARLEHLRRDRPAGHDDRRRLLRARDQPAATATSPSTTSRTHRYVVAAAGRPARGRRAARAD